MLEKVDEPSLFAAHDFLDLPPGGNVVDAPIDDTPTRRNRIGEYQSPLESFPSTAARRWNPYLDLARDTAQSVLPQAADQLTRVGIVIGLAQQKLRHRAIVGAKELVKRRVGIKNFPIRVDGLTRIGYGRKDLLAHGLATAAKPSRKTGR